MFSRKKIDILRIIILLLTFLTMMLLCFVFLTDLYGQNSNRSSIEINKFYICKIDGIIVPTISNYISKCLDKASGNNAGLLVIINTPGGLEAPMREISDKIINTSIPVISYVYPEGARAASAGVFIVYASDIAAMSPSTSIGAAHPVNIAASQQTGDEVLMDKVLKDSISYIRNLAKLNNRNADWAEKAVSESDSISSEEALKLNVINLIAADTDELLKKINGTVIEKKNSTFKISTENYFTENIEMSFAAKFLHIITNPNIAYVLFILGLLGIIYEFSQPGLGVSGAIGVICIILGLYAFSVLPINYAGLALIVLSIILFILDIKLNVGGMLSLAGITSLIIGSFILIDTSAPYLQIARSLIIGLSLAISAFLIIVIRAVYKVHRKKPVTGNAGLVGTEGVAIENLKPSGLIKTHGEIWKAVSIDTENIKKGSQVKIITVQGLILYVKKVENTKIIKQDN
ncbi:MAG: nodulation protein NfeD [Actinobacteria bacterium]|nr:nodulation protein NfeD [Actinomycetota bacterium]MBM3712468.1 nodulation protein NfeD [Actinomycetota bacterium]